MIQDPRLPQLPFSFSQRITYNFFQVLDHFLGRPLVIKLLGKLRLKAFLNIEKTLRSKGPGKIIDVEYRTDLTEAEFKNYYVKRGIPVVFKGAAKSWDCVKKWDLNYIKELQCSNDKLLQATLEKAHKAAIEGIKKSIQQIEVLIDQIIKEDPLIYKNYLLIKSVPGIGHLTAVYIICCTNNFVSKVTGKQLASYAGVVPFEHSSGVSIKGRNRVHKMANKELKKMLHLCALTAIKYYPEFQSYFNRGIIISTISILLLLYLTIAPLSYLMLPCRNIALSSLDLLSLEYLYPAF